MAKVEELRRKQAADRRTALLGLAADRIAEQQTRCLTSREMSDLLENRCSPEQRSELLVHLSSCDSCYREWLELQQLLEEKAAPEKPLLFRRKVLTVAGSLLAAAASVVFYLNIDKATGPYGPPLPPTPEVDSVMEESFEKAADPLPRKAIKRQAPPAPSEIGTQEPAVVQELSEREQKVEKKGVTAESNGVESFSTLSARSDAERSPASAMVRDPVRQWLQQVTEKCSGSGSGQEWGMLAQQGRELSATGRFPQLSVIVEHVERLAGGENNEIECRAIMRIIKENHGN